MIKCLKLVTGEEVIGDYEENETSVKLGNAAAIMMLPNPTGKLNIGLVPFLPYSDDNHYIIDKQHIIITHLPSTDLMNSYNRLYGSGIQIAGGM